MTKSDSWYVECRTLRGEVVRRHGPFAYGSAGLADAYHAEECAALGHNRGRRHDEPSCWRVFRFAEPALVPAPVAMVAQPVQQAQGRHTPGPWIVDRNMGGELAPFQKTTGAHLLSSEGPLPLEEREANASLLGAAPDMLTVLEAALGAWRDQFEPDEDAADSDLEISGADFVDWFAGWREQAKAAVAAAKAGA